MARNLIAPVRGNFVYAKIGSGDALALPDLLPGSIVRADPGLVGSFLPGHSGQQSRAIFLVEHGRGLNCGRLRVSGPNRVVFITSDPSLANREFRLGSEARILGVVDLELRFHPVSQKPRPTQMLSGVAETWHPHRTSPQDGRRPGAFLRIARLHAGLSFRSASKLSGLVAKILGNDRYFTSPGTLSDYEARDKMPRHIHKLFTLAIIYCMGFQDLLRAFGIALDDFDRIKHSRRAEDEPSKGFFESIREEFGDFPLFLANALSPLSGLANISLRDVFWLERNRDAMYPSLRGARFVLVNRRSKKPRRNPRAPTWSQPLYLLQQRDGTYVAASCAIEDRQLMLYTYPQSSTEKQPVRRHIDADVVGQIVGIARSVLSPP